MKVIIEPETDEEKASNPRKEWTGIAELAFVGWRPHPGGGRQDLVYSTIMSGSLTIPGLMHAKYLELLNSEHAKYLELLDAKRRAAVDSE